MSTNQYITPANAPTNRPRRGPRQWWTVVTTLLATAVFSEAVFAGAMLSGVGWGRTAHHAIAVVLIACALLASLVSIVTLRAIPHGRSLSLGLLALALTVCLQTAVGALSAHGANLLWVHVPLGVALVGLAMQTATGARRLGTE